MPDEPRAAACSSPRARARGRGRRRRASRGRRPRLQQPEVEDVERDQVASSSTPSPAATPAGTAKRADLAQEAVRAPRPVARREREEEGRDADRERADDREVARQQRVLGRRDPDRDDQERGEDRLRDEELRHPLDVAEDPPALGDHRRDRREVAVDEHDVGDGLRHLRARALRDREARRLQRGHVVDAVADHRHVAAAAAQRLDDAALALGRDPPDDRERRGERGRAPTSPLGQLAAVERRLASRDARVARDRAHRRGASPESTTISTPCSTRNATVSRVSGRSSSASTARPSGRSGGGPSSGSSGSAPSSSRTRPRGGPPPAARRARLRAPRAGTARARRGRSAMPPSRSAAPAPPRRGTGRPRRPAPAARGQRRARAPRASGSAPRTRRRSGRARRASSLGSTPSAGTSSTTRSAAARQRARLVDADRVDRRERLDRVQLLRERAAPRHPQRGRGVGDRDEQDQALGDERHHPGDGRVDGVADRRRPASRARRSASRRAAPSPRAARRAAGRSRARAASAGGGTRGPSRRSARRSCPRRPPRPRTTPVPSTTNEPDRTSSPAARSHGRDSPVRIDSSSRRPVARDERAVGDDLVAGREPDEVALDDLARRARRAARRPARRSRAARRARRARRASASPGAPARSRSRCSRR